MTCTEFIESPNPRNRSCRRCGLLPDRHTPPEANPGETLRPRDLVLERSFTDVAARAVGLTDATGKKGDTVGLDGFADARAWPGGLRGDRDWRQELAEEIADARNYACWGMQEHHAGYLAGDPEATAHYERFARALPHVIQAWAALMGR